MLVVSEKTYLYLKGSYLRGKRKTSNFFTGFMISSSDICGRGQSAFTPLGNCTIAPKFSTAMTLAFNNIPGFTSE